jgi:hypothetical protein
MQLRKSFIVALILSASATAFAQTDENLLLTPWDKGQHLEARADGFFFPSAKIADGGGSLRMFETESYGRYRYDLGYQLNPSVGYNWTYLNLEQHRPSPAAPVLPHQLTDLSIGVGSPITKIGEKGFLAATGAIGYAGDNMFAEGRGFYGKGSLMYGLQYKKDTDLLFILDYNGNRSYLPDVPLPAFAYSSKLNDDFAYVVGFPVNSLLWHPTQSIKVSINLYVPDSITAQATWSMDKHFALFTGYEQRTDVFHTREIPSDKRLLFHEQRLEAGVQWKTGALRLELAGGYAFGRGFDEGFDSRTLMRVAKVSNEPFVRVSVRFAQ